MPIHVYSCSNYCGQQVELITKAASIVVPKEVRQKCRRCQQATIFTKTLGVPAILTPATKDTARRNDYRRKKPNAIENVLKGKTADGRTKPMGAVRTGGSNSDYHLSRRGNDVTVGGAGIENGRWKNGALIDHIAQESQADWGDSYSEQVGASIEEVRTEKKKELIESGTKLVT